jgi:hypothetical protein
VASFRSNSKNLTESQVEELAALGDELFQELPEPPEGYVPADVDQPLTC